MDCRNRTDQRNFVIYWSCARKHDSGCGLLAWFAKDLQRKQWPKRRCPWKHIAHTAPSRCQGTWKQWNRVVSWWNYPNMALNLATLGCFQITHTVAAHMQYEHLSAAQKRITITQGKNLFCCCAEKGRLQMQESRSTTMYPYIMVIEFQIFGQSLEISALLCQR